ncbi:hypothetical protein JKG47_12930 [Acidithiobacillus sp. MC6.1]|nr:hypothetical protein [Acidithiobacillus sp. MC6.1]
MGWHQDARPGWAFGIALSALCVLSLSGCVTTGHKASDTGTSARTTSVTHTSRKDIVLAVAALQAANPLRKPRAEFCKAVTRKAPLLG